jgi:hypothetical protein
MNHNLLREKPIAIVLIAVALISAFGLAARLLRGIRSVRAAVGEQTMIETSGFYCNLKALSVKERVRHLQLTYEIERARVETVEMANGFAFRFQDGTVSLAELAEWVSAERKCCPFFDFEIEQQADDGPLWLKLRGKEGAKAFMRAEFRIR